MQSNIRNGDSIIISLRKLEPKKLESTRVEFKEIKPIYKFFSDFGTYKEIFFQTCAKLTLILEIQFDDFFAEHFLKYI